MAEVEEEIERPIQMPMGFEGLSPVDMPKFSSLPRGVRRHGVPSWWLSQEVRDITGRVVKVPVPGPYKPNVKIIAKKLKVEEETASKAKRIIDSSVDKGSEHRDIAKAVITAVEGVEDSDEHALMMLLLGEDKMKKARKIVRTLCVGRRGRIDANIRNRLAEDLVMQKAFISDLNEYLELRDKVENFQREIPEIMQRDTYANHLFSIVLSLLEGRAAEAKGKLKEGNLTGALSTLRGIELPAAITVHLHNTQNTLDALDEHLGHNSRGSDVEVKPLKVNPGNVDKHLTQAYFDPLKGTIKTPYAAYWWLSGLKKVDELRIHGGFIASMTKIIDNLAILDDALRRWTHLRTLSELEKKKYTEPTRLAEIVDFKQQYVPTFKVYEEDPKLITKRWKSRLIRNTSKAKELRDALKKRNEERGRAGESLIKDDEFVTALVSHNFRRIRKNTGKIVDLLERYHEWGEKNPDRRAKLLEADIRDLYNEDNLERISQSTKFDEEIESIIPRKEKRGPTMKDKKRKKKKLK